MHVLDVSVIFSTPQFCHPSQSHIAHTTHIYGYNIFARHVKVIWHLRSMLIHKEFFLNSISSFVAGM